MTRPAVTLTLEVTSQQAGALGAERRKTFGADGGTIGRGAGNRWVLADGYVSSTHASITFVDGGFQIADLDSTNGVFVNGRRVDAGTSCPLQAGDRVFIEPYEILASVPPSPDVSAAIAPPPALAAGERGARSLLPEPEWSDLISDASAAPASANWLDALAPPLPDPEPSRSVVVPHLGDDPRKESVPHIPRDYNPLRPAAPPPAPPVAVSAPAAASAQRRVCDRRSPGDRRGGSALPALAAGQVGAVPDFSAVLTGAGLDGMTITPEVARQFGQILRVVVTGVLDVLQARQEVKGEFRIRPTVMQRRRNNPLKHSTDVEDALHNLLLKRGPGYLGPVEAFEDAFKDLRNHQLAMLAGVRVAFETMFSQFEPARLQKEFDRHTPKARRGALAALQAPAKPDYWEFYRDWVQRLSQDTDGTFRTLFGHEFAKAYEDQLDRLKTQAAASPETGRGGQGGER